MSKIRSVCIVDDAIGMRKLGISLLEKLGYEVHVAENGYTALTVIRETNPDACFIDREMPELDGLRLIELLRGWGAGEINPSRCFLARAASSTSRPGFSAEQISI